MPTQFVELLSDHPTHGQKGKIVELDDTITKTLVAAGVAKEAEKPADDEISKVADTVVKSVSKIVDDKLAAFKEENQKTVSTTVTKAFGSLAPNPATPKDQDLEDRFGFKTLGEFFTAVRKGSPSRDGGIPQNADERLLKAAQGLHTDVAAEGGYLVPTQFSNMVMERMFDNSLFMSRCDRYNLTTGSMEFRGLKDSNRATGSRFGGVRGYWLSEADQFTKSKPTFRNFRITPHKVGVLCYATEEQLADSGFGFNVESKLAQYAAAEIDFIVNDAIFRGDGIGKPVGILNHAATVSVAKEGSQTADTINWPNISKMYIRMHPRSLPNAVWFINQDCWRQLFDLKWPDASGTYPAYLPGNQFTNVATAPFGTLMGRPVLVSEHSSTLGDLGDIVFCDFSQYLLGVRGGINSAMSIHVRFEYEETAWRFSFRVDGQPWWDAPITPFKGTANTLSPFVTLAERA